MRLLPAYILLTVLAGSADAAVAMAGLFRDHVVLQRDLPLAVWGTAAPGDAVQVAYAVPDGLRRNAAATAGPDGRWRTTLEALPACDRPGTLSASAGGATATAQDVLVGEVWLASGQSNMQHPFTDAGLKTAVEAIDTPLVRVFRVATDQDASPRPDYTREFSWSICRGKALLWTSVVAYHFAARLQRDLGVPVGVVQAAYAGTSIHAWMSPAALTAAEPYGARILEATAGRPLSQSTPSGCWNAMIHPTLQLTRRGVIWYQGENNVNDPAAYRVLFPALIRAWRQECGQTDMPFLYVQLAGWNTGDPKADWPGLRAVQAETLELPHTGMAVTIDIGDPGQIHPPDKDIVGDRLARLALHRVYGRADVVDSGPVLERSEVAADGTVTLRFANCGSGLASRKPLKAFRLGAAGSPAQAVSGVIGADGTSVVLRHPTITKPDRVAYAWDNPAYGAALVGGHGLPVAPFKVALSPAGSAPPPSP